MSASALNISAILISSGLLVAIWYRLGVLVTKVEEVHKATNSMHDQLVLKTEQEALARGGVEERARADAAQFVRDQKKGT